MPSSDRPSLGSVLRAGRTRTSPSPVPLGTLPSPDPVHSPTSGTTEPGVDPDPIVRTSSLIRRPVPVSRAATSADFHRSASESWTSTPVRASQRYEFLDEQKYAFTYGEELVKHLRSYGYKPAVGYTLADADAETDLAVLLANLAQVLSPISHFEIEKLLDLDYKYDNYHLALNELVFNIVPTVLRGTALSLYEESTRVHPRDGRCALQRLRFHVEGIGNADSKRFLKKLYAFTIDETTDPAPQLAVFRTIADKHRKFHPAYADLDQVEDLHSALRESATSSPYMTPLYLVVLRDLAAEHTFTFASLTLRIAQVWRDEGHLARLASATVSGGGIRSGGGGRAYAFHERPIVAPVGEWKQRDAQRYLSWEGTGSPCVTCFRLWGVTDPHSDTRGFCPYSCRASFSPGKAPSTATKPPPQPTVAAWMLLATPAPAAALSLQAPPTSEGAADLPPQDPSPPQDGDTASGSARSFRVASLRAPACEDFALTADQAESAGIDPDDFEYPAFRTTPLMPWPIPKAGARTTPQTE